jgi:hypothetical protein
MRASVNPTESTFQSFLIGGLNLYYTGLWTLI